MRDGSNGRQANGKFAVGNPGGRGGRAISEAMEFREAALKATKPAEYADAVKHMMEIARNRKDPATAVLAFRELSNRLIGKPTELVAGETHNHYPILVTTTAEALKKLEANRSLSDDPLRGIKRLPKGNGQ